MEHASHLRLSIGELTADQLDGAVVYDMNDEKVGTISHVHGDSPISRVVIDVGGFLGIGAKPVIVDVSQLQFMRDSSGSLHAVTGMTQEQLKALPEHTDD